MKHIFLEKLNQIDHFLFWSLFFGTVHTLFSPKNRSVMEYLLSFFIAVPLGTMAGVLATEAKLESYLVYLIVAGTALLAQDVVKFILTLGGFLSENSETIIHWMIRKILGHNSSLAKDLEENNHNDDEEGK